VRKKYDFSNYLFQKFRVSRIVRLGVVLSGGGRRLQRRQQLRSSTSATANVWRGCDGVGLAANHRGGVQQTSRAQGRRDGRGQAAFSRATRVRRLHDMAGGRNARLWGRRDRKDEAAVYVCVDKTLDGTTYRAMMVQSVRVVGTK